MAFRSNIKTVPRKQGTCPQSYPKNRLDLWNSSMEIFRVAANIEIIQRFQSKVLRIITCYQHESHSNPLGRALIMDSTVVRKLKRCKPNDLTTRYAN